MNRKFLQDRGTMNSLDTSQKSYLVFKQWLLQRISIAKLKEQETDNVKIVRDAGR